MVAEQEALLGGGVRFEHQGHLQHVDAEVALREVEGGGRGLAITLKCNEGWYIHLRPLRPINPTLNALSSLFIVY